MKQTKFPQDWDDARVRQIAPELLESLHECCGAMDSLRTQVEQMRRMFEDEDGTIAAALEDFELADTHATSVLGKIYPEGLP